jgi:hypothetical protein
MLGKHLIAATFPPHFISIKSKLGEKFGCLMMGGSLRPYFRRSIFGLDGLLILVALMAGAVIAGAVIRTEAAGQASQYGSFVGGLRSLGPSETLVLFEDGTAVSTAGWSAGQRNSDHVGLGAIWLVQPGDTTLTRVVALPDGTVQATVRLDLIAIDDWALEGLELAVNGQPVLRQRFSSRPELIDAQMTEDLGGDGIMLRTMLDRPRPLGFAEGTPALNETRLVVEMAVATPGQELELTIAPMPSAETPQDGDAIAAPIWAVDNVIVVAASLP